MNTEASLNKPTGQGEPAHRPPMGGLGLSLFRVAQGYVKVYVGLFIITKKVSN
jgi:hypothetical protein